MLKQFHYVFKILLLKLMINSRNDRCDPKLFKDDVDIKFSRSLNSCKVPQVKFIFIMSEFCGFLFIDFLFMKMNSFAEANSASL